MRSSGGGGGGGSGSSSRAGSACSRLIDVTSNAPLLLPPATTAASLTAEERTGPAFLVKSQHHTLNNEVEERDNLTTERNTGRPEIQKLYHYRNAAETARSELAALLVKYEYAQAELLDLKSKLTCKEVSIQELKGEVGTYRENDARQSSLLSSVQSRLQELEKESDLIAISKEQADLKAQSIFQDNLKLKEKIYEQEGQIRNILNESEENKIQASMANREQGEFIARLCRFMDVDMRGEEEPQEFLLSKISDMHKENSILKEQISTFEETINVCEMESKASRETIMRLVSELSKEQNKTSAFSKDMEKLSSDLNTTTASKQSIEKEVKTLQGRLTASQRATEGLQREMSQLKKCASEKEESLKSSTEEAWAEKRLHNAFKEQIITLLGSTSVIVDPSKETILEKIREMCHGEESRKTMVSELQVQIAKVTETLETQTTLYKEALQRAKKAEKKSEALHDELMRLESELVSGDVTRDALKLEKQKCLKFLDQISETLKLDSMAADIGFDMRLDAVLARTEQLIKLEGDTLTENKIMARNLQRKLKAQKEKLDSKELHMTLLRQKIVQLEEEKQVRTALAVERDEANLTIRTLHKKLERFQNELVLARETNTDLKAKLADTNELKIKTLEQDRTIEDLSKSREQMEKTKVKAEKQLTSAKSQLHVREREAKEEKERSQNMLESVTSELKTLKASLQNVMKRERQLADFREVVAQMLGLNIAMVALPDYEIMTRLEGLIHSHQHHFIPCVCLKDMAVRQDGPLELLH